MRQAASPSVASKVGFAGPFDFIGQRGQIWAQLIENGSWFSGGENDVGHILPASQLIQGAIGGTFGGLEQVRRLAVGIAWTH